MRQFDSHETYVIRLNLNLEACKWLLRAGLGRKMTKFCVLHAASKPALHQLRLFTKSTIYIRII